MNKKLILAAAVVATLAGCAKNEINPVPVAEQEISWQAVVGPKTKADPQRSEFSTDNVFVSYAYYLQKDQNWADNSADAKPYITNSMISYKDNVWKNAETSYYWPKDGKLTFFSWSLNADKNTALTTGTVECNVSDGIKASGYSAADNHNLDYMVADIAPDYAANAHVYYTDGVPTLFKHKLCQMAYKIQTDKEYTGTTFNLVSVALSNIAQAGDYKQLPAAEEGWTSTEKNSTYVYSSSVKNSEFNNTTILSSSLEEDQLYYIPQEFAEGAAVKIVYTITNAEGFVETVTSSKTLAELFGKWSMNTKYELNIKVALNEILWDPAVEEWGSTVSMDWTAVTE